MGSCAVRRAGSTIQGNSVTLQGRKLQCPPKRAPITTSSIRTIIIISTPVLIAQKAPAFHFTEKTTMISRAPTMPVYDHNTAGALRVSLQTPNATDHMNPCRTERLFTVVMLFYLTGVVMSLVFRDADMAAAPQTNPIDLAVKATLYAVSFVFISLQWGSFVRNLWNIKWLLALLLIAIISTQWSQNPSLTLRSDAVLLASTAFGVYFGTRYTVPEQLRLLAWTYSFTIALSYFFALFLPSYGIEQESNVDAWKGAFSYKNVLAEAAVFAMLVFLFVRPLRRSFRCLGLTASFALLFLSRICNRNDRVSHHHYHATVV